MSVCLFIWTPLEKECNKLRPDWDLGLRSSKLYFQDPGIDTYKHYYVVRYVPHRLSVLKTQVSFGNCAEHSIFMVFIPLGVRGQEEVVGCPKSLYFCPRSGLKMST